MWRCGWIKTVEIYLHSNIECYSRYGNSAGFPLRLYFKRVGVEGFVEESSRHRVESISFSQRQNCLMILAGFLRSLKQSWVTSFCCLTINSSKVEVFKTFCNKWEKMMGWESDVSTVQRSLSSKVKIKISISTNYIVKQRSDKCKSMKMLKSGVLKTIRT